MCGRYTLSTSGQDLAAEFGVDELASWLPRYNIAPTQEVPVLVQANETRLAKQPHWGLVPSWSKDKKTGSKMINARAETVAEKPSFRTAFRSRRCLVIADGYYEWIKRGDTKQTYYITTESSQPFTFAGLWESWTNDQDPPYESCSIITCVSNDDLAQLHTRMPVLILPTDRSAWLDHNIAKSALLGLLKPSPNGIFSASPVSTFVNSPAHEGPDCIVAQ
ncbi:MAG: putative SOS response-associated peptidase YedK [Gammaproteobacteria bacterium]|jgi:putative SOS response-associated peptidase YedK